MDKIKVLVYSNLSWENIYRIPQGVSLCSDAQMDETGKTLYDVTFIDRNIDESEVETLINVTKAYTVFMTNNVDLDDTMRFLLLSRKMHSISTVDIQKFFDRDIKYFFSKPYGEKFNPRMIEVSHEFRGDIRWIGYCGVELNGDFGTDLKQVMFWSGNIPIQKGQCVEFWLEYEKTPGVEITLSLSLYKRGYIDDFCTKLEFTEEDMQSPMYVEYEECDTILFASIRAKGYGRLNVKALHDRISRREYGTFIPGGESLKTSKGEEVFCYFDPGDMKPPLNVYFSGYKTMEGFEGYYLLKKMGCPFLLIAEPRLEGGAFYMGSIEYERLVKHCIYKSMLELRFSANQVIMSGLSMGTTGAMYYACDIRPHAVIIGKPLASIGDIAYNEKISRPGGFSTSLDILLYNTESTGNAGIQLLNEKFWNKFENVDFKDTKFVVAYMIEDDYDMTAYGQLLSHLNSAGVQVYGKGLHGRHNDNTGGIVSWFTDRYRNILSEDFSRD